MVRGLHRAVIGAGVASTGEALWVSLERAEETRADTDRAAELAREYRLVVENILEQRGAGRFAELLHGVTEPGAVADTAGLLARPVHGAQGRAARDPRRRGRAWTRRCAGSATSWPSSS